MWSDCWIGLTSLVLAALPVAAEETRTFRVWRDGEPAGTMEMHMSSGGGAKEYAVAVHVNTRTPVGSYQYTLASQEVWRDGQAIRLRSSAEEDGAAYQLTFDARSGTLRANGRLRDVPGPVWPTTFAQLATPGPVTFLDADSGRITTGRLDKVRDETVRAAQKNIPATRYHVSGGRDVTLWYDTDGRLVRQSWIVAGSEMVLELINCDSK